MKEYRNNIIIDNWAMRRKLTKEEKQYKEMLLRTEEATRGKKRILDPFVGWIER